MHILFLGGTRFLGRHAVDTALARGHAVTLFTRGRTPNHWGGAVTMLAGDRDPKVAPGLDALARRKLGRRHRYQRVRSSRRAGVRRLLRGRAARYLFVSSISVYADGGGAGRDESAPVGKLDDPATEEIAKYYGPLKAACEDEVRAAFGASAIIVRPGLIVGPHDSTDRFGYWVARFRHPSLLGDRAAQAVVPAPPDAPVQFIDARDLADWMIDLVEAKQSGTFNATSLAGHWTWGSMVDALRRRRRRTAARLDRRGAAARTQGRAVDGLAAVDPVDVRRRGRLHGIRLPPCRGRGTAYSPARGDDRCHGGMACRARQQRRMESRADRGRRAGNPRVRGPGRNIRAMNARPLLDSRRPR